MKSVIAFAAALAASAASAFHIQVGASGWARHGQQWVVDTMEVGATSGTLSSQVAAALSTTDWGTYYYYLPLGKRIEQGGSSWGEYCYIRFIPGGGLDLYAATASADYTETYGARRFTAAECVKLGTFGYTSQYHNYAWDNAVVTIRGDPYSTIVNDTGTDRTVNGVTIPAGEGRALPFPIYLVMEEIEGVKFYDLESGNEITCHDYASYGKSGVYYNWHGGYYCPSWTGNIRICDGTTAPTNQPPAEPLVFGDMKTANEYKLLFAENDAPIYADGKVVSTNIQLQTWWDFTQSEWGGSPKAYINATCVCNGHSTSHIIAYTVSTAGMKVYDGIGYVDFTMSQTPQSGYSGGGCTMKCWDASLGGSTSAYENAPAEHKAAVSAGLGVARFRLKVNVRTGTWMVYPL